MKTTPKRATDTLVTRSAEFCIADPSLYERTARRAYELFQQRGGIHGHDVEDWIEAERQIVAQLVGPAETAPTPKRRRATTSIRLLPRAKL